MRGLFGHLTRVIRHTGNRSLVSRSYSTRPKVDTSDSPVNLTPDLINHLERTSLVDFGNDEAIVRLQEAVKFAEILFEVDTAGVKPLDSVLEQETVYLRPDCVVNTNTRQEILMNVPVTEEHYIVAPPGNIPLEQS